MQRINTANKAANLFGAGKDGYQAGNPATGTSATFISPDALNAIQEEISQAIEGAGIALNPANNAQLLAAIQSLITNRNISGLVRSLTPIGGALVREWADIANAVTVGGIEIGYSYNVAIDPVSGAWAGRDVADICWLQKWHDTAGTFEIWSAVTGVANAVPAWVQVYSFNANTGTLTVAPSTAPGHVITQGQVDARIATALANVLPAGSIFEFAGTTAPAGSLICPTAPTNVSRTTYAALFAAIGTTWGVGDGATTFGLPYFPADYASVQASANVGSQTVGQVISHSHTFNWGGNAVAGSYSSNYVTTNNGPASTNPTGGSANFAAGVRVLKCVKY